MLQSFVYYTSYGGNMEKVKQFYVKYTVGINMIIFVMLFILVSYAMVSKIHDDLLMDRIKTKVNEVQGPGCYNDRTSNVLNKYMLNFARGIKDLENTEINLGKFKKAESIMIDKFDADMKEFCKQEKCYGD